MTDKECLLQIVRSLRLKETTDPPLRGCVGHQEYRLAQEDMETVELGAGNGYSGFYDAFMFDKSGKCVEHGCWE